MIPYSVTVVVILLVFYFMPTDSDLQCHSGSSIANASLATKTPYRFTFNKDDSPPSYSGCTPIKFWSMIRHGTRNPSREIIRNMNLRLPEIRDIIVSLHREGKGTLCNNEIEHLAKWIPFIKEEDEKKLAHEGEDELLELAERYQKRFPQLLPESYSNSSFKFQYTATQRAEKSAKYFAVGLFGRHISKYVWFPESIYKDPVLRFYKLCDRWRKSVDKNPDASMEYERFVNGPEMKQSLLEFSQRIGGNISFLNMDDFSLIYTTCAFETAWFPKKQSPWCSLLSDTDFKIFEFAEDLDHYWIDGYGYEINYKQACPTLNDMFSFFSSSSSEPKAVLYFSHSGTLLKMLAHLGLYRDPEPLLASKFMELGNRSWRLSQIGSFASNIAFVLYRCGEDQPSMKILTLHQERPIRLRGCPLNEDLCDIKEFQDVFQVSLKQCNFDHMCTLET